MRNKGHRVSHCLLVTFWLLLISGSGLIYAATSVGIITTIAGDGNAGFSGDGGLATEAELDTPVAVILDEAGNFYIADRHNNRIRKVITPTNVITTVVGSGLPPGNGGFSGDNGPATAARLNHPIGLALDKAGNLYIADALNNRIRKIISATGVITTVAGDGSMAYGGDNGLATNAQLQPSDVVVDDEGNLYIADANNNRIRKIIVATAIITTVAGSGATGHGNGGFSGDGGLATAAQLNYPVRIALDGEGNLYVADADNNRIRKVIVATGVITTVAGSGPPGFANGGFSGDGGPATSAQMDFPAGIAIDALGNLYIADNANNRIRKVIAATGIITTVAGNGVPAYGGDNGPATQASLGLPAYVTLDKKGEFFLVADQDNHRIRKVELSSKIDNQMYFPLILKHH
jgi:trimeric autotransporter adhesin